MEILLGALAEAILGVLVEDLAQQPKLAAFREKLRGDLPAKRALQRALAAAYEAFSNAYPGLAAAFFDEHFLQKPAVAAELAKLLTPTRSPAKPVLKQLWREQLKHEPDVDLLQPLTFFLDTLQDEVKAQPALKPSVDSRALEQLFPIKEYVGELVALQREMRDHEIERDQQAQIQAVRQSVGPQAEHVFIFPPVNVDHFTGREPELASLERLILQSPRQAIVGLWGGPGVGKSALARYFAEQQAEQFPDGVIGLDARNKDAQGLAFNLADLVGEPIDPERELGPAAIMQSRFARRRALLVLDNANLPDIRDLIPGGNCVVLVTTRDRDLLNPIGLPSEAWIRVHRFDEDDALTFLARLVGEQVVQAEKAAAQELARLVGDLPLALRIAGSTLRGQFLYANPLARYVDDLRDEQDRLRRLQWRNDDKRNVRAVFGLGLPLITREQHVALACLGACAESGFGLPAAAAAAGLDEDTAEGYLSRLVNLAFLNFDPQASRLRFHPLLCLFARSEAQKLRLWSTAQERHAAHWASFMQARQAPSPQNLADLEAEQDALLQTARWQVEHNSLDVSFWLGLRHLLEQRGHWQTGIELMQGYLALAEHVREDVTAAHFHLQIGKYALLLGRLDEAHDAFLHSLSILEELGDQRGVAMVLNSLGGALGSKGQWGEAIAAFQRSLDILEEMDDRRGVAKVLNGLGGALGAKGQLDEAIAAFQRSLDILEDMDDRRGVAMVLNSLGGALKDKGQWDEAIAAFRRSLDIGEEMDDRRGLAMVLNSLGGALEGKGQLDEAIAAFRRSLDIGKDMADRRGVAMVLNSLGGALGAKGQWDEAIANFRRSLDTLEEMDDRRGVAMVLNSLGGALRARGQWDEAIANFRRSLDIGEEMGDRRHIAMVLNSLGGALRAKGQLDEAIAAFRRSLDIGEDMGDLRHIAMVNKRLRRAKSQKASLDKWRAGQSGELTAVDHYRAGKHLMCEGDYEAAAVHFLTAITLGQDTSFTQASLGRAIHQLQEAPEDIQLHFERAILLDDKNAWAHNWFSTFLKETGNLAQAEVQARRAVELRSGNAVFLNNLALILMEYGDRAHLLEAQAYFQKAVACAPPSFDWPQRDLQKVEQLLDQTDDQGATGKE